MQFLSALQEGTREDSAALTDKWKGRLQAFQELTTKWKQAGLSSLQSVTMPKDSHRLNQNKELLLDGRKKLGQLTRTFAELSSSAKLQEFSGLLKEYQSYADNMSQCLRDAENAYFTLHSAVGTMPDPYPLLERFVREKGALLEYIKGYGDNQRLEGLLADREAELSQLSNQEVTIKMLRKKLNEVEMAAARQAEAAVTSDEIETVVEQWERRESDLRSELAASQTNARRFESECKLVHERLAEARMRFGMSDEQREQELKQLVAELDESATKIALLQGEVSRLSALPAPPIAADTQWDNVADSSMLELEEARSEITTLKAKCVSLETEARNVMVQPLVDASSKSSTDQVQRLENSVKLLRRELADCRQEVETLTTASDVLASKNRQLESERRPLLEAVRRFERENSSDHGAELAQGSSGTFDLQALLDGASNKPGDEAFLAVAAQRDRLRQRLLALELASSAEVDTLKSELRVLQDERHELMALSRGQMGSNIPYAVHISGSTNLERVETALDMLMSFLSRKVLRNPIARRLFLGYLAVLHIFVAVDLFYQVSGLF